jgi:flagellar motility protein MotE (MotC chaperone)
MSRLLTTPWVSVLVGAIIYLAATVAFWKPTPAPVQAKPAVAPVVKNGASWAFTNPEADQLIAELRAEKENLSKREQELNDLEKRLQSERAEVISATQAVSRLQADFDTQVLRVKEDESANLKKLAKVYADMSADNAAAILGQMDDPAIAKILVFMKESETAAILESLARKSDAQSKRAADLSERLRLSTTRTTPAK